MDKVLSYKSHTYSSKTCKDDLTAGLNSADRYHSDRIASPRILPLGMGRPELTPAEMGL
jgi:hypothetical protein